MATLAVQSIVEAGVTSTKNSAAGGGDVFPNDGRTFIKCVNGSGGAITVTATAVDTTTNKQGFGTLTRSNIAVAVAAGTERVIGPFAEAFNNASGQVALTYSAVTSFTVEVYKLPHVV